MSDAEFEEMARNNPVEAMKLLWERSQAAELELASMQGSDAAPAEETQAQ